MSSPTAALTLLDLIQSQRITAVIYTAVRLGLAELLQGGPRSSDELAAATRANHDSLGRLLTALCTIGLAARGSDGRYALTDVGAALDGTSEHSFKAWAIFEGEMLTKSWGGLVETVMTGKTAAELAGASNSFELMARTPERIPVFNAAMVDLTRMVTPAVLRAYDFSHASHLMDVGGGAGEFAAAVAKQYSHLRATVFDLPRCAQAAADHLSRAGVADRASFVAGDFFQTVPAIADLMVLKSVIHDWNDDRSLLILRNCHTALPRAGTLLLVERIMPSQPSRSDVDRAVVTSDLNMMRGPGGRERTVDAYHQLLTAAGFRVEAIHPAGRFSIIEARHA
jgi:hypothetical protein